MRKMQNNFFNQYIYLFVSMSSPGFLGQLKSLIMLLEGLDSSLLELLITYFRNQWQPTSDFPFRNLQLFNEDHMVTESFARYCDARYYLKKITMAQHIVKFMEQLASTKFFERLYSHPFNQSGSCKVKLLNKPLLPQEVDSMTLQRLLIILVQLTSVDPDFINAGSNAAYIYKKYFKQFCNLDLRKIRLQNISLKNTRFENIDLSKSQLQNVNIVGTSFLLANMNQINWTNIIARELGTINELISENREVRYHGKVGEIEAQSSGQYLAVSVDESLNLYKQDTLGFENRVNVHHEKIICMKFFDNHLATAGRDNFIIVWNLLNVVEVKCILKGHTAPVLSIDITSDNQHLLSGGVDHQIIIWQLSKFCRMVRRFMLGGTINKILILKNQLSCLYSIDYEKVGLIKLSSVSKIRVVNVQGNQNLAVSHNKLFAFTSQNHEGIQICNMETGQFLNRMATQLKDFIYLKFYKDEKFLIFATFEAVYQGDIKSSEYFKMFQNNRGAFLCACLAGQKIYCRSPGNYVTAWKIDSKHLPISSFMVGRSQQKQWLLNNLAGQEIVSMVCTSRCSMIYIGLKKKKIIGLNQACQRECTVAQIYNGRSPLVLSKDDSLLGFIQDDSFIQLIDIRKNLPMSISQQADIIQFLTNEPELLILQASLNILKIWSIAANYERLSLNLGASSPTVMVARPHHDYLIAFVVDVKEQKNFEGDLPDLVPISCNYVISLNNVNFERKQVNQIFNFVMSRNFQIKQVEFSPDGKLLALVGQNSVKIKLIDSGVQLRSIKPLSGNIKSAIFVSPSELMIVTEMSIQQWKQQSDSKVLIVKTQAQAMQVACLQDGKSVVLGLRDGHIVIFDVFSNCETIMDGHQSPVKVLVVSPKATQFFSSCLNGLGIFWDLQQPSNATQVFRHEFLDQKFCAAVYGSDGDSIYLGGKDGLIRFNLNKEPSVSWKKSIDTMCLARLDSERKIGIGTHEGSILLLSENGIVENELKDAFNGAAISIKFLVGKRYVAAAGAGNKIKIWNLDTMQPIFETHQLNAAIIHIGLSMQNEYLLAVLRNKKVIIWDLRTKNMVNKLQFEEQIQSAIFLGSQGEELIVLGSENGGGREFGSQFTMISKSSIQIQVHSDKIEMRGSSIENDQKNSIKNFFLR